MIIRNENNAAKTKQKVKLWTVITKVYEIVKDPLREMKCFKIL